MKKILLAVFLLISTCGFSQVAPDAFELHETAKTFLRQGDYENAILVLNRALLMQPNNLEMTKDLLFSYYVKRDFVKAIEIGKVLVEREDADVQSFQMLGMTYKSIAEEKEAEKLYKKGLKKFPNEGILYSEYGDLIAAKQIEAAIKLWEKGVEVDPNNVNNYYHLSKYYADKGNTIWSILFAETFLNMESFTARSTELKNLLLDQYKRFFIQGATKENDNKKASQFAGAVADILLRQQGQLTTGITPESLTLIRTRFILDWYNKYAEKFPFRLFEHQKQLLQEGMFQAYNFWLFGPAANLKTYQTWQQYHQEELNNFLGFIRSKVYKVPEGQQYKTM
jgi:tetratricopeptide (TPR) repeat protein